MGGEWRLTDGSCRRNDKDERCRRHGRKAERIRGGADEDVRGNRASRFFLMIDDRPRGDRNVDVVLGEMRVQRLTVMVLVLVGVEMHVHHRRADGANVHEQGEGGGGQPAKHVGIVAKDCSARHLTIS